jgi:hypothetical protein
MKFTIRHIASAAALVATAVALIVAAPTAAATSQQFHATFRDVAFQNDCTPPIVFCGGGVIGTFGSATTIVRVTRNVPIAGTSCADVAGVRQMILDDGSGTLVATFIGIRCPLGEGGHASTVDFTWTIDGAASIGVFAGATGAGTGVNTTAGNVQVASLSGTITLA